MRDEANALRGDAGSAGTGWIAVVPLKRGNDRKSRLSPMLSVQERGKLADGMAAHVLGQLRRCAEIETILVLAPEDIAMDDVSWVRDRGRGLNAELDDLRRDAGRPLLVIHADLPFLDVSEVELMLASAQKAGSAIAPDRHGKGTNALALLPSQSSFAFGFGPDSRARHLERLEPGAIVVERRGLALDIDTPADLLEARSHAFPY